MKENIPIPDSNLTWSLKNKILTISGTGAMPDYARYGAPWNWSRRLIETVIIKEGVATIGGSAFSNCRGLTSIHIPNSVTTIGEQAFIGCSNLTSIHIPNSVTEIGYRTFDNCRILMSITIRAIMPPSLHRCAFAFKLNYPAILLKVPHQSVEAYRTVKGWSRFKRIVGSDDYKEEAPLSDEDLAYNAY